ncbi:MAG TPA: redoxin domain-containing protein [Vicinamibacterales bacterium]|nr:redoxin domain-containing protein [Vicinamibacterales bacterium]
MLRKTTPGVISLVVLAGAVLVSAQPDPGSPAGLALQRGEIALASHAYMPALEQFKNAKQLEVRPSPLALYGMARAYHGLKAYKDEVDVCTEALKYVQGDDRFTSLLHNQIGMALTAQAGKSLDKLKAGEAEFRAAIALPNGQPIGWYNLGVNLLKQNRDEEGTQALERYLDSRPTDMAEPDLARGMIENPRRAREPLAPDFTLTTDAGDSLSLKDLAGKTVLMDFWGPWSGPCRAATPSLVRLNKQFAAQPFALVGVSSDSARDRQVWQKYIEVNKMPWFQYLDLDHRIHRLFGVTAFPTYIILGADGMIRERIEGYGVGTAGELESKIKKSLKATAVK